jgi:hypothetical protein
MRRRRLIVGLVVLALVAAAAVLWPRGPKPCRATFEQVREGMTYDEVCAAVGAPPGDYSDGYCLHSRYGFGYKAHQWWLANDGELFVEFGEDGTAVAVSARPAERLPEPPALNRLRARIGL